MRVPKVIRNLIRKYVPKAPAPSAHSWGSRGTGAGGITPEEVDGFLYNGDLILVSSSNVAAVQYFHEENRMMVEFLGDEWWPPSAYMYMDVTEENALAFIQSSSKGTWVWDNLRIRGTKYGHRKPYVQIRP